MAEQSPPQGPADTPVELYIDGEPPIAEDEPWLKCVQAGAIPQIGGLVVSQETWLENLNKLFSQCSDANRLTPMESRYQLYTTLAWSAPDHALYEIYERLVIAKDEEGSRRRFHPPRVVVATCRIIGKVIPEEPALGRALLSMQRRLHLPEVVLRAVVNATDRGYDGAEVLQNPPPNFISGRLPPITPTSPRVKAVEIERPQPATKLSIPDKELYKGPASFIDELYGALAALEEDVAEDVTFNRLPADFSPNAEAQKAILAHIDTLAKSEEPLPSSARLARRLKEIADEN